jgi:hypothetical protein
MTHWVGPIRRGWVVRGEVPGPDVDEFAEPDRVTAALAQDSGRRGLLAVQHPHRTPEARAAGLSLPDALPIARTALSNLLRTAYRPIANVVAPYTVDGPDGSAVGLLCVVDPAGGLNRVRHMEHVYPDVVAERAEVLAGLGCLTSAALLVPVSGAEALTEAVRAAIAAAGEAAVSTVDGSGRRHRLWLVPPDPDLLGVIDGPLLVADGNHRVAAAAGLGGLLALVTAGPDLRIGAFHRVLAGTGLTAETLRDAWLRVGLAVRPVPPDTHPAPGCVVVRCSDQTLAVDLPGGGLDHAIVEDLLLGKALGLDPEGSLVRPLPANRPPPADADAVLHLAPVPFADVLAVHERGELMPRKSTFFTPKPRSGLVLSDLLLSSNDRSNQVRS